VRRHNPIPEDLRAVLKSHGVSNYSIHLLAETGQLFAYVEVADERQWAAIAATPECRRWWAFMQDMMETNADHSPRATELREVFYLE
jgi:L-rhamnose mutarotase